jgi:hypothetical protein
LRIIVQVLSSGPGCDREHRHSLWLHMVLNLNRRLLRWILKLIGAVSIPKGGPAMSRGRTTVVVVQGLEGATVTEYYVHYYSLKCLFPLSRSS